MRALIEIFLTLLAAFAAVKLGWIGTILFVLVYLVAFSFKWPFLARRTRVMPRFIAFLGVFLTVALILRWLFGLVLASLAPQGEAAARGALGFLLGSSNLVAFWSVVGGFGATALLAALLLLPYGRVVGASMYSQYDNYKGHEREAAMSAISILLGIDRGTLIVSSGQVESHGDNSGSLTRFGGPGILIVQEGHAVITEISGKLARVVGRGITWLKPFERISMVVPLYLRGETIVLDHITTRDHLIIDEFEYLVYHKVDAGEPDEQVANGLLPYNPRILINNIWSAGGGDWRNAIRSVAQTVGRDVFGRYTLEALVTISEPFRSQLKQELIDAMNEITKKKMGINIAAVDFGKIKLSPEVEGKLIDLWTSQQQAKIEAIRSEAQAKALEAVETARAKAQAHMIGAISKALSGTDNTDSLVRLRFLEALEKISQDPATKVFFPSDMRYLDDQDIGLLETRSGKSTTTPEPRSGDGGGPSEPPGG